MDVATEVTEHNEEERSRLARFTSIVCCALIGLTGLIELCFLGYMLWKFLT